MDLKVKKKKKKRHVSLLFPESIPSSPSPPIATLNNNHVSFFLLQTPT